MLLSAAVVEVAQEAVVALTGATWASGCLDINVQGMSACVETDLPCNYLPVLRGNYIVLGQTGDESAEPLKY